MEMPSLLLCLLTRDIGEQVAYQGLFGFETTQIVLCTLDQQVQTDQWVSEGLLQGLHLMIVGFYWLSHHRIFMVIRRHGMTLIWLNFAFLLCIELQPIFNSLRASYPTSQTTSILYALEQAATGLMLLTIWWYAAKGHRLIDKSMDRFEIMSFALRALLVPMVFLFSIAIILFRNDYAIYFWLLVIVLEVADLIYRRIRIQSHRERYPAEASE